MKRSNISEQLRSEREQWHANKSIMMNEISELKKKLEDKNLSISQHESKESEIGVSCIAKLINELVFRPFQNESTIFRTTGIV